MQRRLALPFLVALAALVAPAPAAGQAYRIPPDNPFATTPGAAPEVYVYGLRNPFRWSFDRQTGDMIIGDVGAAAKEEIDFLPAGSIAGANLGWNCREGTIAGPGGCSAPGAREPVYEYDNVGSTAVTGGYVVRDAALPSFVGRYLFADFYDGDVLVTTLSPGGATPPQDTGVNVPQLAAFGEDGLGRLYVVSLAGVVSRLTESGGRLGTAPVGSFDQPIALAAPAGDDQRLFIAERVGRVILRAGGVNHEFLDITGSVKTDGERGLLAVAPAPDYASSGRLFVFYTANDGDLQLDAFRRSAADPNRADPGSREPLLTIEHSSAANHNGGQLLFGPDGMLYLSTGDGGGDADLNGDAQNLGSRLGKVLRIDASPPAAVPAADTSGPPDTSGPRLLTRVKRRQRLLRLGGVVAYARCPEEACTVAMSARLRVGRRSYALRRAQRTLAANQRGRLRAKLTRRARRALRRALRRGRHPRGKVALRARDGAGNRSALRQARLRARR